MDHLTILKIAFSGVSGAGAACFALLALKESRRSFERWAGLAVAVLFAAMAAGEVARVIGGPL